MNACVCVCVSCVDVAPWNCTGERASYSQSIELGELKKK